MSDEQRRPDVRRLWQSQVDENACMSLEDLRTRVSKMNRLILYRASVAGLASLIFIGLCGATLTWTASTLVARTDVQLIRCVFIIGAGCAFCQFISIVRRARRNSLCGGEPNACAAFYRSELEQQRNSSRRSAVWVPLAFSALWAWGLLAMQPLRLLMIVIWILFVPFWIYQNTESARTCQRELDELNASSGQ
jgi:hypothetical protein